PVPSGATTGNVVVMVGGVASNGVNFTVQSSIKLVQHGSTDNGASVTGSVVVTLNGVASGDLLTCSLTSGASAATTLTVSDSVNGAWSAANAAHYNSGIGQTTGQYYVANSKAGNVTITGTSGSAGPYEAMNCQEWSGVATASPLDQGTQQDGTTANPTAGSVTTGSGGELILGALENVSNAGAGSGFTLINDTATSWLATEYEIQGSAGTVGGTWTAAANGYGWTAEVATFKSSTGGGGSSAPAITSLSPNTGVVGTVVTITGSNFGVTQGTSTVKFNGTAATTTAWSTTSITATVPTGATTGNVVVTVGGTNSNGLSFTVTMGGPVITSLNPTSGTVGISVTITGSNFGATQGTSTVKFNGTAATTTAWSTTSITATVPMGATTGNVVVTVGGTNSNGLSFTVTMGGPVITSLNPTSGTVGISVTITGSNFGATQGTSTVKFNGTAATTTAWSTTSITANVPTGATTGNVVVTVGGNA